MFVCLCAAELSCGRETMTFGSWVSPSIICVLDIKLHSSDLVARAFTCWTISPALLFSARTCSGCLEQAGRQAGTLLNHLHWMRYTWLWRFRIETSIVVMCCSLSWITRLSWVTLHLGPLLFCGNFPIHIFSVALGGSEYSHTGRSIGAQEKDWASYPKTDNKPLAPHASNHGRVDES